MKICVVGLGIIGSSAAEHIRDCGFDVVGYDIVEKQLKDIETFTDWQRVPACNIYVVAVTSDNVEQVCGLISEKSRNALVCVESTVPVGACRAIAQKYKLTNLIHCPHRFWAEDPVNHGIEQLRAIGTVNETSLGKACWFYLRLGIPLCICSSVEVAEICKVGENAYRFVQIAFAEELKMICDGNGIPFEEAREACNTKWNIDVPEARDGISGFCLPQDIQFLMRLSKPNSLLNGAISANNLYKERYKK